MPVVRKGWKELKSRRRIIEPKREAPKKRVASTSWLKSAHKVYHKDERPIWDDPSDFWRPSSISGADCDRESVIRRLGYRGEPNKYNLKRIFTMGKYIELMWQADFKEMGVLVDSNVRVEKNFPPLVKGEYDVKLIAPDGQLIIGEIKSIAGSLYKGLPTQSLDPEENMLNLQGISLSTLRYRMIGYISQLQMYLNMTGTDEGLLIMDNKDDQRWRDYRIVRDEEWIKPILARCERLEPYRANRIVPACSCVEPDKRKTACLHLPEEEVPLTIFKRGVLR